MSIFDSTPSPMRISREQISAASHFRTGLPDSRLCRLLCLGAAAGTLALVWLVFLPWLGRQAPVRSHIDALHAAEINASAMFYSELECQQWLQK